MYVCVFSLECAQKWHRTFWWFFVYVCLLRVEYDGLSYLNVTLFTKCFSYMRVFRSINPADGFIEKPLFCHRFFILCFFSLGHSPNSLSLFTLIIARKIFVFLYSSISLSLHLMCHNLPIWLCFDRYCNEPYWLLNIINTISHWRYALLFFLFSHSAPVLRTRSTVHVLHNRCYLREQKMLEFMLCIQRCGMPMLMFQPF